MFNIVLVNPEIPPNTGSTIRLAAGTGTQLHIVEPIGFDMSDQRLRRAGLDYHEFVTVQRHTSWQALTELESFDASRCFMFHTAGLSIYSDVSYEPGDWLIFGNEAKGLPKDILGSIPPEQVVRMPMLADRRSNNLATSVGIGVYEAWRQCGFAGAGPQPTRP